MAEGRTQACHGASGGQAGGRCLAPSALRVACRAGYARAAATQLVAERVARLPMHVQCHAEVCADVAAWERPRDECDRVVGSGVRAYPHRVEAAQVCARLKHLDRHLKARGREGAEHQSVGAARPPAPSERALAAHLVPARLRLRGVIHLHETRERLPAWVHGEGEARSQRAAVRVARPVQCPDEEHRARLVDNKVRRTLLKLLVADIRRRSGREAV